MNDDGVTRYSLFEATSMIAELLKQRAEQPPSSEPWEEAEEYLLAELKAGRLIATGLPATREVSPTQQVDAIEDIPVGLWAFASFDPDQYRNGGKHFVAFHGSDTDQRGSPTEERRVKNPHLGDFYGQMTFNRHEHASWYAISLPAAPFNAWLAAFRGRHATARSADIPTRIEPWWNLDQALLWIASRDHKWVQAASVTPAGALRTWPDYCMKVGNGAVAPVVETDAAAETLVYAIQNESLVALVKGAPVEPVSAYGASVKAHWPSHRAYLQPLTAPFPGGGGEPDWKLDPLFRSEVVMQLWPAVLAEDGCVADHAVAMSAQTPVAEPTDVVISMKRPKDSELEAVLADFYDTRVAPVLSQDNRPTNDQVIQAAKAAYPRAAKNPILTAWQEVRRRPGTDQTIRWEDRGPRDPWVPAGN